LGYSCSGGASCIPFPGQGGLYRSPQGECRTAGILGIAALVFIGHIFSGLTTLQVAAAGHAVAIMRSALLASALVWHMRRRCLGLTSQGTS